MVYVWRAGMLTQAAGGSFPKSNAAAGVMSVDVSEDSVELIEAVVTDHQLAFAAD